MRTESPTFRRPLAAALVVLFGWMASSCAQTAQPPAADDQAAATSENSRAPEGPSSGVSGAEPVTATVELPDPAGEADGQFAARVNGVDIPLDDFRLQAFTAMGYFVDQGVDPSTKEGQEQLTAVRKQVLDDMIRQALMDQYAEAQKIQVSDEEVDKSVDTYIENLGGRDEFDKYLEEANTTEESVREAERRSLIGKKVIESVVGDLPTTAPHVHARHILCKTREDCEDALARLKAGEEFAAVAKEVSEDVTTNQRGGDLDWVARGMLPGAAFEDVIFSMEPGELSGVIDSEFGFHVVEVLEVDPERELDEAQQFKVQEKMFLDWVSGQRDASEIEILIPDLAVLES